MSERSMAGMRKAYLHVGSYRTGTTSLQTAMIGHRHPLLEIAQVYVPVSGTNAWKTAHHELAQGLFYTGDIANIPAWKQLRSELHSSPKHSSIFISSEDFGAVFPERIRGIKEFLFELGYSTHVIVALRNQVDALNSEYCEATRAGRTSLSMDDFLDRHIVEPRFLYKSHYLDALEEGDVPYNLFSYDRSRSTIVQDILKLVSGMELQTERGMNASGTAEGMFLIKATARPELRSVRTLLAENIHHIQEHFQFRTPYFGMSRQAVRQVLDQFREPNEVFLEKAGEAADFFTSSTVLLAREFSDDSLVLQGLKERAAENWRGVLASESVGDRVS